MAQFYLDQDAKSEIGYSSTPVTVNGTAGNADRILLRGNAANVTVGPAVEIVDFYGDSSAYAFVNEGGMVAVYRDGVPDPVAWVASNDKGTELRFADGALTMGQDPETGALTVGGQQVTDEKAAYAGDELNTDHKSEAGGGSGPQPGPTPGGKGEEYSLPGDLGEGNIIASGTGDDTYTGSLNKDSQIVDASTADNDTLNISYSSTNDNGGIVNVENINATWTAYNGKAVFDAENVQHVAGSNITVNSSRAGATDALVNMAQNHHVIAGENITGELTVSDADTGARVTMNNASTLILQTELVSPSRDSITVNAGKDFALKLADPNGKGLPDYFQNNATDTGMNPAGTAAAAVDSDRADKAILVSAGKDLTITLDASLLQGPTPPTTGDPTGAPSGDNLVAANIVSVGEGKVTADIGTVKSNTTNWQNISGLQVETVKLKSAADTNLVVDRDQHLNIALGAAGDSFAFAMQTYTDDDPSVRNMKVDNAGSTVAGKVGNTNAYAITADLAASKTAYGRFDLSDGNLGTLNLVIAGDTVVREVSGTGELAKTTQHPVRLADAFVFSGRGNVLVEKMTADNAGEGGVTVAAADGFQGMLTAGRAGAGIGNGTIAGGDGGTVVYAADVSGGDRLVHLGGSGVDTMEIGTVAVSGASAAGSASTLLFDGGAGSDKVNIKSGLTVNGDGDPKASATFNMGAGDDVITLEAANALTSVDNGRITLDFGAGEADTLVLKGALVASGGEAISIRNLDVLDVTDANAGLTLRQDKMDAWDFQMKGSTSATASKVTVVLDGARDLDLSGMKVSDTATSYMAVTGARMDYAATITLDKAGIHTTIGLSGDGATAEKHLAIDGFKGHEDSLRIQWAAAITPNATNFAQKGFNTENREWTTLDDALQALTEDSAGADLIGFKFGGSTYFILTDGAGAFGDNDTLIELVGDKYEKGDFDLGYADGAVVL